jgi:hypothetical protein
MGVARVEPVADAPAGLVEHDLTVPIPPDDDDGAESSE